MAESSGGKCFIWFILICIAVGGFLLWRKYSNLLVGKAKEEDITLTDQNLPKGIFTSEEACYLLHADTNSRAGEMHKRNYPEKEVKEEKSLLYTFNSGYPDYHTGYVKFFRHKNYYYAVFDKELEYKAFRNSFSGKENKGGFGDCKQGIYALNEHCFACDMDFRREMGGFVIMIMRSIDFSKQEVRLSSK